MASNNQDQVLPPPTPGAEESSREEEAILRAASGPVQNTIKIQGATPKARRVGKKVGFIAFLAVGAIAAFGLYNNSRTIEATRQEQAAAELLPAVDAVPQAIRNIPKGVAVVETREPAIPDLSMSVGPSAGEAPLLVATTEQPEADLSSPMGGELAPTLSEFDQRMLDMRNQALAAKPIAEDFESESPRAGSSGAVPGGSGILPGSLAGMPAMPGAPAEPDPYVAQNMQDEKVAFIEDARSGDQVEYLSARPRGARSAFELSVGTIIPAVLINGLNSDLPGLICGLVSQNVFDSARGQFLLIPQGARICGRYDSNVSYGQAGALVVWDTLTFPNGSTLALGGMQGYDRQGYAGFRDKVDNHLGRLVGFSLLTSLFSASLAISQDDGDSNILSNQEQVSAAAGREISQLGVEMARRNLQIQPTIKIRPGYRFVVKVDRAIAFPSPYR